MSKLPFTQFRLSKVWAVLLYLTLLALSVFGQAKRPTGLFITHANPNGTSCSNTASYALLYNGTIYTCGAGNTYAASGGGGGMVYPAAGIAVSTGSAWGASLTAPAGAIVGTTDTQTLTNKTIAASEITGLAASATTDTTNASNISSGTLNAARFPANQTIRTLNVGFDGGGSALSGTLTRCTSLNYSGTIQGITLMADQSGSATLDVRVVSYASYTGPASATSITASDTPALSSAVKYQDTTLTGWTTALSANSMVCFVLSSPATITWLQATIKVAAN